MAEFNPNINQQPLPQVTSRGSLPPTQVAGLFEDLRGGATNLLAGATDIITHRIGEEAESRTDYWRRVFSGREELPSYLGGQPPPEGTSETELDAYRRRLERLTRAYRTGNLQESHYWLMQDMETRRVRERFPGHRREVDAIIQNILGTTPANALVSATRREAAVLAGNAGQERRWLEHQAISLGLPEADRLASNDPPTNQELTLAIASNRRSHHQRQEALALLEEEHRLGRNVTERAVRTATSDLTTQFADIFDRAAANFGGREGFMDRLRQAIENPPTASGRQELESMWRQVRSNAEAAFRERITTWSPHIANGETVTRIVNEQLAHLDAIGSAITNQQWGYLGAIHRHLQAVREGDQVSVLENSAVLRRMHSLNQIIGNQAFANLMVSTDPDARRFSRTVLEAARHAANLAQVDGPGGRHTPSTLERTVREISEDTTRTPEERNRILADTLRTSLTALGAPDATLDTVRRYARGLFTTDGPEGGLSTLTRIANSEEVYAQITSRGTATNMLRIRETDPVLYRNYRQWVLNNFAGLTQRLSGELENIAMTTGTNLRQDPTTGLISYDGETPLRPVLRAMSRYNDVVSGVMSLMNAEGVSPEDRARVISLVQQNIDLNRTTRGTGPRNLWDTITETATRTPPIETTQPRHVAGFLDYIGRIEGGRHGYNSAPTSGGSHQGQDYNRELTGMTITQILGFQNNILTEQENQGIEPGFRQSALGRYQINRRTLNDIMTSREFAAERERLGITRDSVFDNQTQDALAVALLNVRGGLREFLNNRITREEFQNRVARIWAGSPTTEGRSRYEGVGPNTAIGSQEDINRAIEELVRRFGVTGVTGSTDVPVSRQ